MKKFFTGLLLLFAVTTSVNAQVTGQQVMYYPNGGDAGGYTLIGATFMPGVITYFDSGMQLAWLTIAAEGNAPADRIGIAFGPQPFGTPYFTLGFSDPNDGDTDDTNELDTWPIPGTPADFPPSAHTHAPEDITSGGASSGQVLKWNGSAWAPSADNNTTRS